MNEFIARNGIIAKNNSTITGSLNVSGGITGSLSGTASFTTSASYALSSSQAQTASFALTASTTPQLYRIINNTDSATVSSSTAITLIYSQLIPANTFAVNDVIRLSYRALKTGVTLGNSVYFYINASNSVSGATIIGQYFAAATTRMIQVDRKLYIKNTTTNTEMFNTGLSNGTYPEYIISANSVFTNIAIDWTTDRYIIFANALGSASDSLKGSSFEIERIRTT